MATHLIPIRQLITDSWNYYLRHWNRLMEVSLWLLAVPLLIMVVAFAVAPFSPDAALIVMTVCSLLDGLFGIWITIRLIKLVFAHDPKEEGLIATNLHQGWDIFLPMVWVTILNYIAVFAGVVLLFFPGIWIGVVLAFSKIMVVTEKQRDIDALTASAALVKGRWWATFWRLVVPGAFFFILIYAILQVLCLLLGLVVGFDTVNHVISVIPSNLTQADVILSADMLKAQAVAIFLNRIPEALFTPVFVLSLTKLYRSLKESK